MKHLELSIFATLLLVMFSGFKKAETERASKPSLPKVENQPIRFTSITVKSVVDSVSPVRSAVLKNDTDRASIETIGAVEKSTKKDKRYLITDPRDGQTYKTVQIGNQIWFAENLRYSIALPQVADSVTWNGLTSAAWCYYQNDSANNDVYGKLYNWYAVNEKDLCPAGWHVPSKSEWEIFNASTANSSRVISIPVSQGGCRGFLSEFYNMDVGGYWWSSTPDTGTVAHDWSTSNSGFTFNENVTEKRVGYSVRCIKDW